MIRSNSLLHFANHSGRKATLLAVVMAGGIVALPLSGQDPAPAAPAAPVTRNTPATSQSSTSASSHFPKREQSYYSLFWGVDSISVKAIESGELIRFTYRVLDPEKAKPLNDKNNEAAMYVPSMRAKLVIPNLEKVGQLRQVATPEAGRSYWMAFSNPGAAVKRGDRVNVVIGNFHVDGLVIE